jgi:hypothetical protein
VVSRLHCPLVGKGHLGPEPLNGCAKPGSKVRGPWPLTKCGTLDLGKSLQSEMGKKGLGWGKGTAMPSHLLSQSTQSDLGKGKRLPSEARSHQAQTWSFNGKGKQWPHVSFAGALKSPKTSVSQIPE